MSLLDDIQADISKMSDAEIAEAAQKLQAQKDNAKARMTPERVAKQKDREKARRQKNAEILRIAKEKGLLGSAPATPPQA